MEENQKLSLGASQKIQPGQAAGVNMNNQAEQPKHRNLGIDEEFLVPEEDIELPSKGVFYKNGQKTVRVRHMTAESDDILFSTELLRSNKVLDAVLQFCIVDKTLSPDDMLIGDRNAVLVYLRRTGIGDNYNPGLVTCPSCIEEYEPDVDLSKLPLKYVETMPDESLWYDFLLPTMKKNIKFRLLSGNDENRMSKVTSKGGRKISGNYKIAPSVTERYRLQIMEVEGNKDKLYISKLISAMPLKDSITFREYVRIISPGVDFNYEFTCKNCGHKYEEDVPINHRLFYPDAEV